MRPRKTLDDYLELAEKIQFLLPDAEEQVNDKISTKTKLRWVCRNCGREYERSYNDLSYSLRINNALCICRKPHALTRDDYLRLAEKHGISWYPEDEFLPKRYTDPTRWKNAEGIVFKASYSQLAYRFIPANVRAFLS